MSVSPMFRSLRHRNARLFFIGLLVSNVGTWMQMTAMSLLVYRITGKATDVGITLFCQFLPMLVLGVWAGAVADRRNKQRMAVLTQSLMAVQAIALGVIDLAGLANLPVLYLLSLVLGVISAFDNPARRSFVLELVEPQEITNAISLNTAVMTGSRVFGPALAVALGRTMGSGWLFIINGLSFAAILWPLVRIDRTQLHPSPVARRGGTPVRDALRFITHDARLLVIFVVFTLVGTFSFNYSVSLLRLADKRFENRELFGWLLASTGMGSMVGSLLTGARERVSSSWFFAAGVLLGASGLAMAWAPNGPLALVIGLPLGAGGAAFIAGQNAIVQQESPPDMRGRLLALGAVAFLGTTPIGSPITGWVADHIGAEWGLGYGAVVALVAVTIGVTIRWRSTRTQVPTYEYQPVAVEVEHSYGGGVVPE